MSPSTKVELGAVDASLHAQFPGRRFVKIKLEPAPGQDWADRFNKWNVRTNGREHPKCEGGFIVFDYAADSIPDEDEIVGEVRSQFKATSEWHEQKLAAARAAELEEERRKKEAAATKAEIEERLSRKLRGE